MHTGLKLPTGEDHALLNLAASLLESGYSFVTPTPATHRRVNARPENAFAHDAAGIFGWSRPFRGGTLPEPLQTLAVNAGVLERHGDVFRSLVRLSTLGGMGFVHSAFPTETSDAVFFGPDTYRFANALVAAMPRIHAPARAVDIGTGAGAGALSIARAFPHAQTFMADINPAAVRLACINADLNGFGKLAARQSDLLADIEGSFDLIVANPPYLADASARLYRDGGGTLGSGLSLQIIKTAIDRLTPGGTLLLYTGAAIIGGTNPFAVEAGTLLDRAGFDWRVRELDPDVFGEELESGPMAVADRIAVIWLAATRPL
jgi:methylase of polypeptide subunit release factors